MNTYHGEVKKVLIIVLALNVIMALLKIAFGYYSGILSRSADGYDSFLDVLANILALAAVYLSSIPRSKSHPYGYSKIENFASLVIGFSLLFVSFEVLTQAIDRLLNPQVIEVGYEAFLIMITSLMINLSLSRYEKIKGKQLKSDILIADSNHTKADVLITSIVIISLILMYFNLSFVDPVISIIITVIILKTAIDIFRTNFKILLDANMIDAEEVINLLSDVDGVFNVHNVRTRGSTSNVYMDMHMVMDSDLSIDEAYDISKHCEKIIMDNYPEVKDVLIHLEGKRGLEDIVEY